MSIGTDDLDLSAVRSEYVHGSLRRGDMHADPLRQFEKWYREAAAVCSRFENSMQVATVDASGHPDLRTVLLKGVSAGGFLFYTNLESNKARQIRDNPSVALLLHWQPLERQVIIRGTAVPASRQQVEAYFRSRPRGSQLGAWASRQSAPINSRTDLEAALAEAQSRFRDREVAVPDYWGGYSVVPDSIEFWQGQPDRLHDRFRYDRTDGGQWSLRRLSP